MELKYYKTHNGRYALRKDIKSIKGIYYHVDDLVKFKNKNHRIDNKKILYNLDEEKYEIKGVEHNPANIFFIVDRMYYSKNTVLYEAKCLLGTFPVFSKKMALFLGAKYTVGYRNFSNVYSKQSYKMPFELTYNFDLNVPYQKHIVSHKTPCNEKLHPILQQQLQVFFDDGFKIGQELESSAGILSEPEVLESQLIPLKDGSISGIEYVTPPIGTVEDYTRAYYGINNSNLSINDKCSFHLHVSGLKQTKKAGLSFYYLCCRIQDELHACIPTYKRSIGFLKNKDKDHSKLFTNFGFNYAPKVTVEEHFPILWKFLTGTANWPFQLDHPLKGSNKWNYSMRYYYVNMLNLYFSKSKTVEFRLFPPSMDAKLITIWTLLGLCIVKYSKENATTILNNSKKITLIDVVLKNKLLPEVEELLVNYIKEASALNYENYVKQKHSFGNYTKNYKNLIKKLNINIFDNKEPEVQIPDNLEDVFKIYKDMKQPAFKQFVVEGVQALEV